MTILCLIDQLLCHTKKTIKILGIHLSPVYPLTGRINFKISSSLKCVMEGILIIHGRIFCPSGNVWEWANGAMLSHCWECFTLCGSSSSKFVLKTWNSLHYRPYLTVCVFLNLTIPSHCCGDLDAVCIQRSLYWNVGPHLIKNVKLLKLWAKETTFLYDTQSLLI